MNTGSHQKVTALHLKRNAYLYVRQLTMRQVFENTESTQRQYALRQRAITLGWPQEQIVVIDSDLGQSALRPWTRRVSRNSSPKSAWAAQGLSWDWKCPVWRATPPTGTGCWKSVRWRTR